MKNNKHTDIYNNDCRSLAGCVNPMGTEVPVSVETNRHP